MLRTSSLRLTAFLLASSSLAGLLQAQGPKNMLFEAKLKSVAVFRDGYGFYTREGKVKLEDGWATTNFVPTAIKGTVWVYSLDPADKIDTIITTHENKIDFADVKELKAKLADKIGLNLNFELTNGQRFEGSLNRLLDDMLLVQAGAAYNAIPYSQIRSITIVGYPIKVKLRTKNPNGIATLGIAYLQEGIRWEPSYILDMKGETGTLSLRASIQNTTEALSHTDVQFVVGSPFIANRGINDMIALMPSQAMAATKTSLSSTKDKDLSKEVERAGEPEMDHASPKPTIPPASATVTGEEAGELFFYNKPDMTLAPNDVAMVSVFDSKVPVMPSFEWNADGEEVSYLLKIKNTTAQPLTTGTVFVVEDQHPLGQDTIRYTASQGTAELRLSRGIGLHVEKTEAELKRGNPVMIGKTSFIPVTLSGTLTVTNYRKSKANVKINKTLRGKVTETGEGGKIEQTQILNGEPNAVNDLIWEISVEPGKAKVIHYQVVTYISAERAGAPPVPATQND